MESVITDFNENGFSILHGILESETLEAVKRECEALVDELASQRQAEGKSDGASIFATKMPNNRRSGQHKDIYSTRKRHQRRL